MAERSIEDQGEVNATVMHVDASGAVHTQTVAITLARFLKHFVLAGSGFTPTATLLARGMGAVAWYWDFVRPVATGSDSFGEPEPILRDPTLKAHFSNLAGRALADLLSREFEHSWVTWPYEGALLHAGLPIAGERPDLLAVNPWSVVAIEAKGYSKKSVSADEMSLHKEQARQGSLPRHAWAASVAYGLYDSVKVKYHDPEDEAQVPEPNATRIQLQEYFAQVETAATQLGGDATTIDGRPFIAVALPEIVRGRVPLEVRQSEVLDRITLLLSVDVAARVKSSLGDSGDKTEGRRQPAERPPVVNGDTLFVDTDGIGISIAISQ